MTSNDVFLGGGSSSGSLINAELPNIKGELNTIYEYAILPVHQSYFSNSGSIEISNKNNTSLYLMQAQFKTTNAVAELTLNASLSNSIYKDSGKLIPKHYVIEFWIKFK